MVKIKGLKGKKANRPKPRGALSKPPRLKAAIDGAAAAGNVEDAFQMDTLGEAMAMATERTKQKSRTKHSKVRPARSRPPSQQLALPGEDQHPSAFPQSAELPARGASRRSNAVSCARSGASRCERGRAAHCPVRALGNRVCDLRMSGWLMIDD